MNASELLRAVAADEAHYFVVTPDGDGLAMLIPRVLRKVAASEDVQVRDGRSISLDEARQLAADAYMAPRGGSSRTHVVIRGADKLTPESVGALLLAVEETRRSRFIFLAARSVAHVRTLESRSRRVDLPFLTRKAVLANLQALRMDARRADEREHYDGTLGGTIRNLQEDADRFRIRESVHQGMEALPDLLHHATGPVFDRAVAEFTRPEERTFLSTESSDARRRLIALLVASRSQDGLETA